MNIKEIVYEKIAKTIEIAQEDINDDSLLVDDLGADSLETVELVMELEEAFDMEISDNDAETLVSVQKIIDYIEEYHS
jgi:acyl carrier protein|tara:strand:+ start:702 stop:935 length:234 start_codon:yes stop_codon:yes gene_type:complete